MIAATLVVLSLVPARDTLERVDISSLTPEILEAASTPFLIEGVEDWPAKWWTKHNITAILDASGPVHLHAEYNQTLKQLFETRGYVMTHALLGDDACYSDPYRPYSPILVNPVFLSSVRVPELLRDRLVTWQLGIGALPALGVPPEDHPASFFLNLIGAKRWVVHPPSSEKPAEVLDRSSASHCNQTSQLRDDAIEFDLQENEILYLPDYWWHETCGLGDFAAGIGGLVNFDNHRSRARRGNFAGTCKGENEGTLYTLADIPYCAQYKHLGTNCPSILDWNEIEKDNLLKEEL